MPRGDGTGRSGAGPLTGRGLGYCAGYDEPGFMHPANDGPMGRGGGRFGGRGGGRRGRGFGRRGGMGMGRRGWGPPMGMMGRGPGRMGGWHRGYMEPMMAEDMLDYDEVLLSQDEELDVLSEHAMYLEQNLADLRDRIEQLEASKETTKEAAAKKK